MIFTSVTKSLRCHPSLLPLDLWQSWALLLTSRSVCCAAWLRVLEHISELWVRLLVTPPLVWTRALCRTWEKGLPSWPQISRESKFVSSKGGLPLPWFTAPTETKLGTATVSAPGPLSSGQDELFAEDIQMYKEQIRLTQSSFARREGGKEREPADFKKTSFPLLLEWVKGLGNENSLVYSKC